MNTKKSQYVLTLANCGSFAQAAAALGISQPSLSQYIKKIEQELGTELFDRTGGSVRLTDAGRIYLEAGRKMIEIEHQMMGALNDLSEHKTGSVVVGTSPYRSAGMMPIIARRFQEQYPGMHLVVEEMTSQELSEATEHGQFDLCITMKPINERLFCYERIAEEELILAVPQSFRDLSAEGIPDRKYPAIDAKAIDRQPFVMITEGQWMQQALNNLSLDYGLSLQKATVVKSLEAQIAMVRAGVGMALLPSGIERFCSSDEVKYYSFKQALPKRDVVVMWQRDRQLNQITRDLIGIMKDVSW